MHRVLVIAHSFSPVSTGDSVVKEMDTIPALPELLVWWGRRQLYRKDAEMGSKESPGRAQQGNEAGAGGRGIISEPMVAM